jgi:hypothetical protein
MTKSLYKCIIHYGRREQPKGDLRIHRSFFNTQANMIDYEKAINLQGSWGYTPTTPLVDPQAKDTSESQPDLSRVVTQTIPNNL